LNIVGSDTERRRLSSALVATDFLSGKSLPNKRERTAKPFDFPTPELTPDEFTEWAFQTGAAKLRLRVGRGAG
jgi:hypothetical protein